MDAQIRKVPESEYPLNLRGYFDTDADKNEVTINGQPCHAVILCVPKAEGPQAMYQLEVGDGNTVINMVASALVNDSGVFSAGQAVANSVKMRGLIGVLEKLVETKKEGEAEESLEAYIKSLEEKG